MSRRYPCIQRQVNGWQVTLHRERRGYTAFFGDRGDAKAALRQALAWRDRMIDTLPPPGKFKRAHRLNTTGVVGVTYHRERRENGRISERYAAGWTDEYGRKRKRSFSVAMYGAVEALARAVKARRQGIQPFLRPADGRESDPKAVLRRGRAWRQEMVAQLPPLVVVRRTGRMNKSGVVGVYLLRRRLWTACCSDGRGRKRMRSFSIAKYGSAKALALAIKTRRNMIEEERLARARR